MDSIRASPDFFFVKRHGWMLPFMFLLFVIKSNTANTLPRGHDQRRKDTHGSTRDPLSAGRE